MMIKIITIITKIIIIIIIIIIITIIVVIMSDTFLLTTICKIFYAYLFRKIFR